MLLTDRPKIARSDAHGILAASAADPVDHAAVALWLLVGMHPLDVERLKLADWPAEGEQRRLRAGPAENSRVIAIAPSAAAALDVLASIGGTASALLPGMTTMRQMVLMQELTEGLGWRASALDLRRAAIAEVLDDGTPVEHVARYFGARKAKVGSLAVPRPGYDVAIAQVLQCVFASASE
ncbi:hypothetical protein IPZ58_07430 [Streptomyces roseoverticillatus]|uniref:hypothetical protein n=1 Tax=Streptomyces roseoverticillatus TaxID=66429 RepID=UPI001F43B6FD|nr:hypothetical protein [Streptomyces roseoverticillatus]MCF3101410.1 hypothetical protein [Streptomyces roseoverticillatus]